MGERVVVTGSAGLLGRATARLLQEHGYDVVKFDIAHVPDSLDESVRGPRFDINEASDLHEALAGASHLVHLAAVPGSGYAGSRKTFEFNMLSTYLAFSVALDHGVRRVVWASSESVYGVPIHIESIDRLPVTEDTRLRPTSAYGRSKVLGEVLGRTLSDVSGIPFVALRFCHVMDTRIKAQVEQYQRAAADKAWDLWSYIDVRDAAQAILSSLASPDVQTGALNITAEDTLMPMDSYDLVRAGLGREFPELKKVEPRKALYSGARAIEEIGFRPQWRWRLP